MPSVITRLATQADQGRVRDFYTRFDYAQHLLAEDVILIAESDGQICAALRLAVEQGVLLLRGMRVAADLRRQGIGTQMLHATAPLIGERECYRIPLNHLTGFYGQIDFEVIEPEQAPRFLQERIATYRQEFGLDVVLMRKAGDEENLRF